jgi:hypothetical protein
VHQAGFAAALHGLPAVVGLLAEAGGVMAQTHCAQHTDRMSFCADCRALHAAWARNRNKQIAYGRWVGMVPAEPILKHVTRLREAGLSHRAIAEAAGIGSTVLDRLVRGEQSTLRADTASRLLTAVPQLGPESLVSSLGAARRLQALAANGWDASTLAGMLDTSGKQVRAWRSRRTQSVRLDAHRSIAALYRRIGDRVGPSVNVRHQARTLGYVPPICWDDDGDLDNPQARPKGNTPRFTTPNNGRRAA